MVNFFLFFQNLPQKLTALHNFCTSKHRFPVAANFLLTQSAYSQTLDVLSVCWNIAADQRFRQFSRVNCWRVPLNARSRVLVARALRPPRTGPPHGRIEPLAIAVTAGLALQTMLDVTFLENATVQHCVPSLARWQGRAGHLRAMRLEWLAQAAFCFSSVHRVSAYSASSPRYLRLPLRLSSPQLRSPLIFAFCSPILWAIKFQASI